MRDVDRIDDLLDAQRTDPLVADKLSERLSAVRTRVVVVARSAEEVSALALGCNSIDIFLIPKSAPDPACLSQVMFEVLRHAFT